MNNSSIGLLAPDHLLPVLVEAMEISRIPVCFSFDPSSQSPEIQQQAGAILVVLSPAIEEALDDYEDMLYSGNQEAMFDEDQGREGWDAQRWSDHLTPKLVPLLGSGSKAIPSGFSEEGTHGAEGLDWNGESPLTAPLSGVEEGTPADLVEGVDVKDRESDLMFYPEDEAPEGVNQGLELSMSLQGVDHPKDPTVLGAGLEMAPSMEAVPAITAPGLEMGLETGWEADEDSPLFNPPQEHDEKAPPTERPDGREATTEATLKLSLSLDMSDDPTIPTASVESPSQTRATWASTEGLSLLMDEDEGEDSEPKSSKSPDYPAIETEQTWETSIDSTSNEQNHTPLKEESLDSWVEPEAKGFVLIMGGTGGPGAIREILASLSDNMPVPVLIHQPMPQGRYDVLALNLGKRAAIPVEYAPEGASLEPGKAWVLGEGLAPEMSEQGQWVARKGGPDLAVSRAGETQSALLMVSGAGQDLIFPAMEAMAEGALLFGQEPEHAYEAHTIDALAELGLVTGDAESLGTYLAEHWGVVGHTPNG